MNDQMLPINLGRRPVELLMLGAHADYIEMGCGGTILRLAGDGLVGRLTWVVLSGLGPRAVEARSAAVFLEDVQEPKGIVRHFRDGFFPYVGAAVKEFFEELKLEVQPDLILTHRRGDQHQDHRLVAELTWNTWRHYLILEYEILRCEGDLALPPYSCRCHVTPTHPRSNSCSRTSRARHHGAGSSPTRSGLCYGCAGWSPTPPAGSRRGCTHGGSCCDAVRSSRTRGTRPW
jgi:LmbE family N-acetylglucosaminyl deacetylase